MSGRYYIAKSGTKTHQAISDMHAKRTKAMAERWKFVKREFPAAKKKSSKYEIVSWNGFFGDGKEWGVKLPADVVGVTVIPSDDWKFIKGSASCIKPRAGTKRGKELLAEMKKEKYAVPGATKFGFAIGIKPEVSTGLQIQAPSFLSLDNGDYVVTLFGKMVPPEDVERISDIELEALTEKTGGKAKK